MNLARRLLPLCLLCACAPLHDTVIDGADQLVLGSYEDPDWLIKVPALPNGNIASTAKDKYGVQHGRLERTDNLDLWKAWNAGAAPKRGVIGRTTRTRVRWIGLIKEADGWSAVYRALHPYPFKLAIGWDTDPDEVEGVDAQRWAQGIYYGEVRLTGVTFPETTDLFGRVWETDAARSIVTELEIEPVRPQYHPSR